MIRHLLAGGVSLFLLLAAPVLLSSCCDDDLSKNSIFGEDVKTPERDGFDTWLYLNYTHPYNIQFNYKYVDKESDNTYNLVPADRTKAVAMAKLVKYLWMDSYVELMNDNGLFFKSYCPKIIQLIGSKAYNEQGSVVLGTAEGGMKITFYNVNELDPNNLSISFLNEWFFETMHHEFAHILHQTKNYPTDFKQISTDYQGPSWLNLQDKEAHQRGYITAYASNAPDEDFVELIANYVTHDEAWWNDVLEDAGDAGKEKIDRKFKIVKDYMQESWKIDLDKLREIVQRRSANLSSVDVSDDF
mgnify:FL=1